MASDFKFSHKRKVVVMGILYFAMIGFLLYVVKDNIIMSIKKNAKYTILTDEKIIKKCKISDILLYQNEQMSNGLKIFRIETVMNYIFQNTAIKYGMVDYTMTINNYTKYEYSFIDDENTKESYDIFNLTIYKLDNGEWLEHDRFTYATNEELAYPPGRIKYITNILVQIDWYLKSEGNEVPGISENDLAIQHPDLLPQGIMMNWYTVEEGFEIGYEDIFFAHTLVDRILLLRIDPEYFRFSVHCSPSPDMKYIYEWMEDLTAVAVVNGSFYTDESEETAYGEPAVPMLLGGKRAGPENYKSRHGAILFEPEDSTKPLVSYVNYNPPRIADIENEGYTEGTVSYPTLVGDGAGLVRTKENPMKRANRSFIGIDKDGNVIIGNTQSGFFSLQRLAGFLSQDEHLSLEYALNLDGGPPANISAAIGEEFIEQWGVWESTPVNGKEYIQWNRDNFYQWENPIIIAVNRRE